MTEIPTEISTAAKLLKARGIAERVCIDCGCVVLAQATFKRCKKCKIKNDNMLRVKRVEKLKLIKAQIAEKAKEDFGNVVRTI